MPKLKVNVKTYAIRGKVAKIAGFIGGAFFLLGFIGFFVDPASFSRSDFVVSVVFLAVFIFLIIIGYQISNRVKRFRQYRVLISEHNMSALESIAASISKPVDFVQKDLQKMIDNDFLRTLLSMF